MPSTATITAFYSFSANTKARATQVNNNFNMFRGHIIPIDPNTIAAANNTYDLGSTEYRWRNSYVQAIDFQSNTTTGNALKIVGEASAATPSFNFQINGSEVFKISSIGAGTSTVSQVALKSRSVVYGGADAGQGNISISAPISFSIGHTSVSTTHNVAGSTITLSVISGRPIKLGFIGNTNSSGDPAIAFVQGTTSTAISGNLLALDSNVYICRNTITSIVETFYMGVSYPVATTTAFNGSLYSPLNRWSYDLDLTTGSNVYFVRIQQPANRTVSMGGRLVVLQD